MENNKVAYKYQKLGVPQKIYIEINYYCLKKELYNSFLLIGVSIELAIIVLKISIENENKSLIKINKIKMSLK